MPQQDPEENPPDHTSGLPEYPPREIGRRHYDSERLRAQLALSSSEARFRLLVDGVRDYAIFMVGPNGHVSSWNRGAERILGYRPDEIIGHSIDLFHLEADRAIRLSSEHLRLAEKFGRFEDEGWRVRKDGERFWAHGAISALWDDTGLIGFALVMRDLSERRAAEEALRSRGDLLATVVNMQRRLAETALEIGESMERVVAEIGSLVHADGMAVGVVEATSIVYHMASGISASRRGLRIPIDESLSGKHVRSGSWFRSDDVANDPRIEPEVPERDGVGSLIIVPLVYDGRAGGVLTVAYRNAHAFSEEDVETLYLLAGQLSAAVSHAMTFRSNKALIVERTEALEAVSQSEERFRSLIENASDTIEIVDRDLVVQYASPAAERLLGYSPHEMQGRSLREFIHPDDLPRFDNSVRQVIASPESTAELEVRKHHRSGAWRSMSALLRNLLGDPGVRGLVITCRDVTEQNVLAAQLRQSQKMDAIGQLAGGVAHDFNNLLTVIKGNVELLRLEMEETSPAPTEIEEIRKATDRAASLTRQLLAFSRKQLLHARAVDLNELVEEIEPMLRRLIGEDVQVVAGLDPAIPHVLADPGQMHQVLVNLAVNARDAMPGGGVLLIETSVVDVDERYAQSHAGVTIPLGKYVQLALTDDGTGMSEEVRSRLFEPFFTTKTADKGTGLGLATVYGIVKQSGGFIWATSELGKGASFQILLPGAVAGAVADHPVAEANTPFGGSETVLLVEDEEPLRILAQRVLERHGYRVLGAGNGREAVEIASTFEGAIDLVLTDVVMPGMTGRETAERVGALRPDARLLYMSGYTDDEIIRRGLLDPRLALLEKPFSPNDLARTVRRVLDGVPPAAH